MTRQLKFFLLICVLVLPVLSFEEEDQGEKPLRLMKGEVIPEVPSASDSTQSHAIYIPTNYTPSRKWPILYCYDPRARGTVPIELFREAAEKYGYLIVSSNRSRSDDPTAPNEEAVLSTWRDSHGWFSIDERRAYSTGFSGGSRMSWRIGYVFKGQVAGVIGVGAGSDLDKPPDEKPPFAYFGTTGYTDFNYHEMRMMEDKLKALNAPHKIRFFDGGHQWPPKEVCFEAIEWMELQAMKNGLKEKDPEWIAQQFEKRWSRARAEEEAGKILEAYLEYQSLARDFEGLHPAPDLAGHIPELEDSKELQDALSTRQKVDQLEEKTIGEFINILTGFGSGRTSPSLGQLKRELRISHWRKESEEKENSQEGLLAKRMLGTVSVQAGFYIPGESLKKKEYKRVLTSLSLAEEATPSQGWFSYRRACVYSLDGDQKKALEALRESLDEGFSYPKLLETNSELDSVRNSPEFTLLVEKARQNAESNKDS